MQLLQQSLGVTAAFVSSTDACEFTSFSVAFSVYYEVTVY